MTAGLEENTPARRPGRRRRRAGVAIAVLLASAAAGVWLARVPLASDFIDSSLSERGVPARYRIADLGFGRQRLVDVVIGDPAAPDLVADWVETQLDYGLNGVHVAAIDAGRVRLRGRIVDGQLKLGALGRLLPAPSGEPLALPAIGLKVADGRMRLETALGVVGLTLKGSGRLDDGFDGRLTAVSRRMGEGDCATTGVAAAVRVRTLAAQARGSTGSVRLDGLVRVVGVACGGARSGAVSSDVAARYDLGPTTGWSLRSTLAVRDVTYPGSAARMVAGRLALTGISAEVKGPVMLVARDVRGGGATAGRVALDGAVLHRFAVAGNTSAYDGRVSIAEGDVLRLVGGRDALVTATAGTPVAPLARQMALAVGRAAARFGGNARFGIAAGPGGNALVAGDMSMRSASGAEIALADGTGLRWSRAGLLVDGTLRTRGGGLPEMVAQLSQAREGAPVTGRATMTAYAAGDARLALTAVDFSATPGGVTRIDTVATLSGPLGDGRVERLALPVQARWDGAGGLVVDPACVPLAFERLAIGGLDLRPARLRLCPVDGALLRVAGGAVRGGARIEAPRLDGAIGTTPVALAADRAEARIDTRGFTVAGLRTRLGGSEQPTRLDFASLDGRVIAGEMAGRFAGGGGQIGAVPLLLTGAEGDWRFAGGALALTGAMTVSDTAASPRFEPLTADAVALRLAGGAIAATGVLRQPERGTKVADVAITHRLADGTGAADLSVPGITFVKDGLQPDALTKLTFGVIADVEGTAHGQGRIAWSPERVTSTGTFGTDATDLAAAFGPVTGIATTIRFTDLLALESAPGQVATIQSINPGIPVTDGAITYQTLSDARVNVEGGRWPFAGGTLTLEPTLLDFSAQRTRAMTFRVAGMQAGEFLQQFDFDNLTATGTFDGVLPMTFDESGGRITEGVLAARGGGGTIAYVGELGQEDLGFWGNVAFQALKSLRYRNLAITMNGPLAGEMVTEVRFAGINQGEGAKSNFLIRRLQRLPFVFNIRIRAPFRGLIDSAQSFYDPSRLIERNLPALIEQQGGAVQPPDSGAVPQPTED